MSQFNYIIEKIRDSRFETSPFKHLYIEDFLSPEHLEILTSAEQVNIPPHNTTEELIETLQRLGYQQQQFPGCTTSIKEYLDWYNNNRIHNLYNAGIVEGFGMAWRLMDNRSADSLEIVRFLNSSLFLDILKQKFNVVADTTVSTEIQKYLSGYEISPHPDIRTKCLTYLVNINTDDEAETMEIHTHLLKFKPEYSGAYEYWKTNTSIDRCWVPWGWCDTEKKINKNNTLVMFAPGNDTLHAVKLNYSHLNFQRTQLYGNLWYKNRTKAKPAYYTQLPFA